MGQPAAVTGDQITGSCPLHLIPNPTSGIPQPAPPLPFVAPMTIGTCPTVLIGNLPAAVVGSQGMNTPPHIGLHPSDPFMIPLAELGIVTSGSTSVLFGGVPAARSGDPATCCGQPVGTVVGSQATVLIG
jgi:uncharacterized Zn-binding protein involved in type VI secretion